MERTGTTVFRCHGPHHCGSVNYSLGATQYPPTTAAGTPQDPHLIPINWELRCAMAEVLDERGFLFDQIGVRDWFDARGAAGTLESCERVVVSTARDFLAKVGRDDPHCIIRGMTLVFSPAPHTWRVTAHFGGAL